MSDRRRTIAFIAAALLLIMALVYAGIGALFAFMTSIGGVSTIRVTHDLAILYSGFELREVVIFSALCLIAGYAGLAAIGNWPGARLAGSVAGGATIAVGLHGLWLFSNMLVVGLPYIPFPIGIRTSPAVSLALCIVGIMILWTVRRRPIK